MTLTDTLLSSSKALAATTRISMGTSGSKSKRGRLLTKQMPGRRCVSSPPGNDSRLFAVQFDFEPKELRIKAGETVEFLEDGKGKWRGWRLVRNVRSAERGYVPKHYIKQILEGPAMKTFKEEEALV